MRVASLRPALLATAWCIGVKDADLHLRKVADVGGGALDHAEGEIRFRVPSRWIDDRPGQGHQDCTPAAADVQRPLAGLNFHLVNEASGDGSKPRDAHVVVAVRRPVEDACDSGR